MRTPEGPATLHLRRDATGVVAEAFGGGAGWALSSVSDLIGLADNPDTFTTDHPLVSELHRRHRGWRLGKTNRVFEALLRSVVAQKVTGKEAGHGLRGLANAFSEEAPGPSVGLRLPPDPDRLAEAQYFLLHPLGIEARRADTIRRVAREAQPIDRLAHHTADQARAYLERIPGIGAWTSAETVTVSHGDADAVSVGDFHLKHVVSWHMAGEARGTDDQMLALLEPFRPHRGRVVRLLESLGHEPAFGPRQPIRTFAGY
jgi:3-methyladenine DNA glycosylase/8-oxoguanine DNA glycosylase